MSARFRSTTPLATAADGAYMPTYAPIPHAPPAPRRARASDLP
jgi:hypothetical protein